MSRTDCPNCEGAGELTRSVKVCGQWDEEHYACDMCSGSGLSAPILLQQILECLRSIEARLPPAKDDSDV